MKIDDIEKNIKELEERIFNGEINDYTVNTFSNLCGRAIEYFSEKGNLKFEEYMKKMKDVFSLEGVDKFTKKSENEIKDFSD